MKMLFALLGLTLISAATVANSICQLELQSGPCKASIPRFGFDSGKGKCTVFLYGGCGGNANNFQTEIECKQKCEPENVCNLELKKGPCKASFSRYGYDTAKGKCVRFTYGGCRGNGNRFVTEEACKERCVKDQGTATPSTNVCELGLKTGKCRAAFRRYGYDSSQGQCVPFTYGGCGSNGNNFLTLEECNAKCKK